MTEYRGADNLRELNLLLIQTCMIRRKKAVVLKQLPAIMRSRVVLESSKLMTAEERRELQQVGIGQMTAHVILLCIISTNLIERTALIPRLKLQDSLKEEQTCLQLQRIERSIL